MKLIIEEFVIKIDKCAFSLCPLSFTGGQGVTQKIITDPTRPNETLIYTFPEQF